MHSLSYRASKLDVCLVSFFQMSTTAKNNIFLYIQYMVEFSLSCGHLKFQEPDFFSKLIYLLHGRRDSYGSFHKLPSLISSALMSVSLLTSKYDAPDCDKAIVIPVMSGPGTVSQHHSALLFAQGQVN